MEAADLSAAGIGWASIVAAGRRQGSSCPAASGTTPPAALGTAGGSG